MAIAVTTAIPLARADSQTRVGYLRRVLLLTMFGLVLSAITGLMSAGAVAVVPALQNRLAAFALILGPMLIAQHVSGRMVFSESTPVRWFGFMSGAALQGVAMGYLLLAALVVSAAALGNPLVLILEAMGLTGLAALGMTAYLWMGPRDFSLIRTGIAALSLPMLALMVLSFVWPIGGVAGVLLSGAFVAISAAGLLYQINEVLHRFRSDMYVEGAFTVTMGVLVLFWNILSLLMRLQDRR